jgi:hypothetical protein
MRPKRPPRGEDFVLDVNEARALLFELSAWRCSTCGIYLVLAHQRPDTKLHLRCGGKWQALTTFKERALLMRMLTRRML